MAWNPSPEVAVARDAAKKLDDADECIVVWINHAKQSFGMASFGKTRALCSHAGKLGDAAYDAVRRHLENE